jgi:hypothetical protein
VLHGRRVEVVHFEDSLALAAARRAKCSCVALDDAHRLAASLESGVLGSVMRA